MSATATEPETSEAAPQEAPDLEATVPGPTPKRRRRRTTTTRATATTQVKDQLANGAKAISLGVLMTSGDSAMLLNNPEIVGIIEDRCDKFGAAWAAVAEQDPRVAKWLETLMTGGVWIAAGTQTAALAAMLAVMSGRLRVPLAAVIFLVPELRPHLTVPPPEPATAPGG